MHRQEGAPAEACYHPAQFLEQHTASRSLFSQGQKLVLGLQLSTEAVPQTEVSPVRYSDHHQPWHKHS